MRDPCMGEGEARDVPTGVLSCRLAFIGELGRCASSPCNTSHDDADAHATNATIAEPGANLSWTRADRAPSAACDGPN